MRVLRLFNNKVGRTDGIINYYECAMFMKGHAFMAFIELRDVYKTYNSGANEVRAVDGISFEMNKGEFVVVVGPSGAGKTTLLNILGGMDAASGGDAIIDGQNIAKFNRKQLTKFRREDVGFVFQFYNLVQNLTALENVELAVQATKKKNRKIRDNADARIIATNPEDRKNLSPEEVLEKVGLSERRNNFPAQLSGGEQQRVSIARALAKNPKLLLCDEPTGALDYQTGKSILKLLWQSCRDTKMTVIVITHNKAITPMADRVIRIKNGKVCEEYVNEYPVPTEEIEW